MTTTHTPCPAYNETNPGPCERSNAEHLHERPECHDCIPNPQGGVMLCPTHAQAPALLAALTALIYASDQCKGHTGCGHSMQPWKDARAILRVWPSGEVAEP